MRPRVGGRGGNPGEWGVFGALRGPCSGLKLAANDWCGERRTRRGAPDPDVRRGGTGTGYRGGQQRWPVMAQSFDTLKALGKGVYEKAALPLLLELIKKQIGLP